MRPPETDAPPQGAARPRPPLLRVWDRALDLVFPPRCVSCDAFGSFICPRCSADMVPAEGGRCLTCWMPVSPSRPCRSCRSHPLALRGVRSAFVYDAGARDAVLALKFRGLSAIAPLMARSMAQCLNEWNPPVHSLVPVPLSGHRRRLRGYNQSELLAKELSRLTGIPLARQALVRRRSTPPQVHQTDEDARRRNVAGAFAPGRPAPNGGVLLIDDVVTTGATLDACARVLLSEGIEAVFALTFARED
jgi:ComF family protein